MHVLLNNEATVKALKVVYAPDSITVSGRIAARGHGHEHEHHVPEVKTAKYRGSDLDHPGREGYNHVEEHSFEPVYLPDHSINIEYDVEDIEFEKTISFDELKATPGFACYSQVTLGFHFTSGNVQLHEVFSRSKATKKRSEALEENHFYVLAILVPCANVASFDDCLVTIHCAKDALEFDGTFTELARIEDWRAAMPQMKVEGSDAITAAGGLLTVTYAWPDGTPIVGAEVHAEPTAGYVNRQRVHTDKSGKAYFTVVPLALDKGERFRVKFGFKHFTGKTEKTLTVA